MTDKLFIASGNPGKISEFQSLLGPEIELRTINDLDNVPKIEETEPTLEGNASLKARAYYKLVGIPCCADDTGLEVFTLNNAPGVYSARYAGPNAVSNDNMNKLLNELRNKADRGARFRTAICYFDGQEEHLFEGIMEGRIATQKKGENGFGYDPIFIPLNTDTHLAEMSPFEKNQISHRGKAIDQFIQFLKKNNNG